MDLPSHEDEVYVVRYLRLILSEAVGGAWPELRFMASGDRILVEYRQGDQWVERDHPPIRLWHSLIAALHSLLGTYLIRVSPEIQQSPSRNVAEIEVSVPWLREFRDKGYRRIRLECFFSNDEVLVRTYLLV